MFNFFSAKPDHPLANPNEAKNIAAQLTRADPRTALGDATAWLESLSNADGFKLAMLAERIALIGGAAAPQARRLGREFVQGDTDSRAAQALWNVELRFWALLADCYEKCVARMHAGGKDVDLPKEILATLFAGALNARAATQKWNQFYYRQPPEAFWAMVGGLYREAVALNVASREVELHPGHGKTTAESEYLKILLFHVAAMDTLEPIEIELGERLIAHFLRDFNLTRAVRPENVYWIDIARPAPPSRLARVPEVSDSLYFFNGGKALAGVDDLLATMESSGAVPAHVNLAGQYPSAQVREVLKHLALCWAPKPPMRVHVRRQANASLALTHGFDNALQTIAYALSTSRTKVGPLETWSASDVSLGGMAIHGPVGREDWTRIGAIVVTLPEGGSNWLVGIVRRVSRGPAEFEDPTHSLPPGVENRMVYLGIETVSKNARAVVADADGLSIDALILDLPVVGEYARMAVPPNSVESGIGLRFRLEEKVARLLPRETLESGPDFLIANFFVQSFA